MQIKFDAFLSMIILYFSILIVIGIIGYLKTQSLSDYILGGRKIGAIVTALSAGASDMSGWLLMGLPGAVYVSGLSQIWILIGLFIGAFLNWTFIAGLLRKKTEALNNSQTLPEYFGNLFPQRKSLIRGFSSLLILIFFTLYCSAGIVSSARLFEIAFDMPYQYATLLGVILTVSYVFIGGFFAVSWTDCFQAILMVFALIFVPLMAFFSIDNMPLVISHITDDNQDYFSLFSDISFSFIISSLAWGLGYFGQPHILVRFMAASDGNTTIKKARNYSLLWMFFCIVGAVCVGIFGKIYVEHTSLGLDNPENIFLNLVTHLFNPWIAGILFAAVLSAIMSTISCQLLLCSSAVVGDLLPLVGIKLSCKNAVRVGRLFLLITAMIATFMALSSTGNILEIVSDAWAGFGCAFGPLVILSLYYKKITADAALTGMLVGGIIAFSGENIFQDLYIMIPGFVISFLSIIVVSETQSKVVR